MGPLDEVFQTDTMPALPANQLPVVKQIRLSKAGGARLAALVKQWCCNQVEAARRAVDEAAEREGIAIAAGEEDA